MKKFNHIFALLAVSGSVMLTGCIDETVPLSSTATAEQVGESSAALEGLVNGIPAKMSQGYLVYGDQVHETDMAYPALMISQTEMLGDMYPLGTNAGYDWYRQYNTFENFTENTYFSYLTWFTLYQLVKSCNDVIGTVDVTDESLPLPNRGLGATALTIRAFNYYMLTVLFEPKANDYTDCSKVLGLTVPIVDENTVGDAAKNNPRVKHEDMIKFILSDLDKAEAVFKAGYTPDSKLVPNLAVVYGIKAKVYLWDEDYANAAKYARLAIDESKASPVTEAQWLDLNTGFNTANQAWMWYIHYDSENMGNLCNFIGWMSGEADWGYSSLTRPGIDKSLYDKIGTQDFRKHTFLDPAKYDYFDYQTCRGRDYIEDAPAYLSLKFRCRNGEWGDYSVGAAVDVPVMRVEEMYLIEAEAVGASQNVAAGVNLLSNFMKTYRNPAYNFTTSDLRTFQLEVLTQMRIEFWGEGNAFPSAKRLQPGIMQNYAGTNAPSNIFKVNCKGMKPNWNIPIPNYELESNMGIPRELNNPDASRKFKVPSPEGQYSDPNDVPEPASK